MTLDLRSDSYRIDLAQKTLPPQVDCLRSLYAEPDASAKEDGTGAKSPAARQAMASLKDLVGKISKPHAITEDTALQRRRHRIPEAATHFVWAYQLRPWSTDALTGEQLTTLEMYSGEISLASYGGFIYFDETEEVVGINAISLGDSPAFREGVVDRAAVDVRFTANIASPELWAGENIGVETDIYAFGIVMWEVMTRRTAWDWVVRTDDLLGDPAGIINTWVGITQTRPKVPAGLSDHCAEKIRQCLHVNPSERPSAKQLMEWLQTSIRRLQKHMDMEKEWKTPEYSTKRRDAHQMKIHHEGCRAVSPNGHWFRGRYSPHTMGCTLLCSS